MLVTHFHVHPHFKIHVKKRLYVAFWSKRSKKNIHGYVTSLKIWNCLPCKEQRFYFQTTLNEMGALMEGGMISDEKAALTT